MLSDRAEKNNGSTKRTFPGVLRKGDKRRKFVIQHQKPWVIA